MLSSARPPEPCFFDCVGSSLFAGREVVRKHGAGPGWLVGLASGAELIEPGFDVDDGSAVDGVEIFYVEVESIDLQQAAARDADPIDPAHVAVAERTDLGPRRIVSGPASTKVQVGLVAEVKEEHHLKVGEGIQADRGSFVEPLAVDPQDRVCATPVVIGGFASATDDLGNRFECERTLRHGRSFDR